MQVASEAIGDGPRDGPRIVCPPFKRCRIPANGAQTSRKNTKTSPARRSRASIGDPALKLDGEAAIFYDIAPPDWRRWRYHTPVVGVSLRWYPGIFAKGSVPFK
jgi:hypothetical protein